MATVRAALLVALAVSPAFAAPVPKDFKKTLPDYYPLNPGDEWVYKSAGKEIRVVTRDVAEKDGVRTGTLVTLTGETEVATETIRVDKSGVHRTHINALALDPPLTMISFDPTRENKWEVKGRVQNAEIAGTYEVAGKDEVEVPAGKFTAVNVVADLKLAAAPVTVKYWFAEGVGQVKLQFQVAGQVTTLDLKAYKPGTKKEKK